MHILMLSDVYFPRINGVSTSIKSFRAALQSHGHKVTLVAPRYDGVNELDIDDQENIIRIPSRGLFMSPEDRLMRSHWYRQLLGKLHERNITLVHSHTPFIAYFWGQRLKRDLRIPHITTYHTYFQDYAKHYIPFLPDLLLRWGSRVFTTRQCNSVDGVIAPSEAMHSLLEKFGVTSPIYRLPTGLELGAIPTGNGTSFRHKHGINPNRPVLVNVGRMAFEKNIDFLLRTIPFIRQQIPDILLVLAGEGPALASLQQLAHKLNIHDQVRFIGYLDRELALWDCYSAANLFVFASKTETQGLVLLEAMSQSVPVVSTAFLGTKDILQPQRGALIAEDDPTQFARLVVRVLKEPALHARMTNEARDYVNQWSADAMTQRLLTCYKNHLYAEAEAASVKAV